MDIDAEPLIPVTEDDRSGLPFLAGDRDSLESWLELYGARPDRPGRGAGGPRSLSH